MKILKLFNCNWSFLTDNRLKMSSQQFPRAAVPPPGAGPGQTSTDSSVLGTQPGTSPDHLAIDRVVTIKITKVPVVDTIAKTN